MQHVRSMTDCHRYLFFIVWDLRLLKQTHGHQYSASELLNVDYVYYIKFVIKVVTILKVTESSAMLYLQ
jgi:hypothetical protein